MPKDPIPRGKQEDDIGEDDMYAVMSNTECTGLIPTPPVDEAEADSYSEIYDIPYSKKQVNDHLQDIKKTPGDLGAERQ